MDANHFNIAKLALSPMQLNMVKLLKIWFLFTKLMTFTFIVFRKLSSQQEMLTWKTTEQAATKVPNKNRGGVVTLSN